jgi:uncharacterized protein (UPF0332 family)
MTYKDTISSLIKSGIISKAPVDYSSIDNLMKRAEKDLNTAKRNIDIDEECAFTYAYNSMLHCGLALMNSQGYRPKHVEKHKNIIRFCDSFLGNDFSDLIIIYNYMRKSRNKSLQPSQPLLRIFHFREIGIGVFPEGEEFLVVLYGYTFPSFLCFF